MAKMPEGFSNNLQNATGDKSNRDKSTVNDWVYKNSDCARNKNETNIQH